MIGGKWPVGYVLKPQEMTAHRSEKETEALIGYIDSNLVGKEQSFVGPFGRRKVTYCDYAASARAMHFVEDYIINEVLPLYGNIHTSTSVTSMQSSLFREEAREILSNAVNAREDDVVLFAGHGCTGAIRKLINCLNIPRNPIVFFGPCEHHTNLLPWKEIGAEIVRISETKEGLLDLTDLETKLLLYQKSENSALIGCFSAASSTTGILADDIATTILLHQYGALAFWDYSTAAPYVSLDMNPLVPGINQNGAFKDAMFFSGHKFIGGVQSTGILIAKKSLFMNALPNGCSGVPSFFLTHEDVYLKDTELYEESGTAAIVESVRAGMAMKIKETVGVSAIMERESKIVKTVTSFFRKIPEIIVLGSTIEIDRLAIFSIMVRHPRGAYLHHNFVSAVLNDVFGIQARGGCSCSGPYAQDLMGITKDLASDFEAVLQEEPQNGEIKEQAKKDPNYEMLRPGFVRLSFPYFMSESEIAFILEAVKMVATEGWKLLPQYVLNPETGEWRHNSNTLFRERKWLGTIKHNDGKISIVERKTSGAGPFPLDYNDCLRLARSTFNKARKIARRHPVADHCAHFNENINPIRWFMLPSEAQDLLLGHSQNVKQEVPFSPSAYKGSRPTSGTPPDSLIKTNKKAFNGSDLKDNTFNEIRVFKQRSESNSPARDEQNNSRNKQLSMRERCYSLCSALAPERQCKLNPFSRQRLLSCGSQAENTDSETSLPGDIDFHRLTPPNLINTPDLVYVEGITKELATEIKSELREVIAQVEDVLSESNETDHCNYMFDSKNNIDYHNIYKRKAFSLPINATTEDQSIDSFLKFKQNSFTNNFQKSCCNHNNFPPTMTAERFSEYLVGFTSDVVSEMKSEFRDVVNAVDGLISPIPSLIDENKSKGPLKPAVENKSVDKNTYVSMNNLRMLKKNYEKKNTNHLKSMLSSQDSGIHINDRDLSPSETCETNLTPSLSDREEKSIHIKEPSHKKIETTNSLWYLPPKNIWNPTCEAIKEFDMIKDGDRVMVCLNNQTESLLLLHTLHQYQYYSSSKGKTFSLGAGFESSSLSKSLLSYLEQLGVTLLTDEENMIDYKSLRNSVGKCSNYLTRNKLCFLAKLHNYNVLAFGHHLDDISENFFMSVFHNGHLHTMKANYLIVKENLRVIRPFIYVRESSIKSFAASTRLTCLTNSSLYRPKERLRIRKLLAEQETLYPKLYYSLKSALKPLLSGFSQLDKFKMKELEYA